MIPRSPIGFESSPDLRDEIARLEAAIEAFAATAEGCRKLDLAAKIALAIGLAGLLSLLFRLLPPDPLTFIVATAAAIGGVVLLGANSSTARQNTAAWHAAEAKRAELIDQIGPQLVPEAGQQ